MKTFMKKSSSSLTNDQDFRVITNLKIFGALANNTPKPLLDIIKDGKMDSHSKFTAYTAFFQTEVDRHGEFRLSSRDMLNTIEDFLTILRTDPEVHSYTLASVVTQLSKDQIWEKVMTNILSDIFNETGNRDRHNTEKITQLFTLFDSVLKTIFERSLFDFQKYFKDFALKTIDEWYQINFSPSIGKIFSSGRAHMNTTIFRLFVFNGLLPKKIRDYSLKRFQAWFFLEQECMSGTKLKPEDRFKAMEEKFKAL